MYISVCMCDNISIYICIHIHIYIYVYNLFKACQSPYVPWSLRNPHPLPPRLFSAGSWACKKRFLDGGEKMHNRSSSWKIPLFSMLDHPPALNSHFSWACEKKQPQVPSLLYAYIHIIYIYIYGKFVCIYMCVSMYVHQNNSPYLSIYLLKHLSH